MALVSCVRAKCAKLRLGTGRILLYSLRGNFSVLKNVRGRDWLCVIMLYSSEPSTLCLLVSYRR